MSSNVRIREKQWDKIVTFLRSCPDVYVGNAAQCRRFVEGCFWMLRTGAQWRELPERYGNWDSVYQRYARWSEKGIWERMHAYFAQDPDLEHLILDSTVVRAHPCAAGAGKKTAAKRLKP
jgi:transposase